MLASVSFRGSPWFSRYPSIDHHRTWSSRVLPAHLVWVLRTWHPFFFPLLSPLHQDVEIALDHQYLYFRPLPSFVPNWLCIPTAYTRYFVGVNSRAGSLIYNSSQVVACCLPTRPPLLLGKGPHQSYPPPSAMVAPFLAQNLASQVSLPPGDHHPKLKSRVSIPSITNAMRRRKFPHQNLPAHPKNYTKAYGPCTLSLNADHEASSGLPIFSNGTVISGTLEISKVSKMLQLVQIMVSIPAGV